MERRLSRRDFLKAVGAGTVSMTMGGCSLFGSVSEKKKLNFVFFLIDDLGWSDVGCYGSEFYLTPNIDRLAAEGVQFTDAYAACAVCSPTRASIMTGKYPARLNITDWIGGSQKGMLMPAPYEHQLSLEEVTIAEAFKEAGYATGFIGKWHLGSNGFHPEDQGFDLNIGGHHAGHPASYFWPYKRNKDESNPWDVPDLEEGKEGEYLTDRLTDEALKFIDANKQGPFLLYLSHYAVHTPIQSKQELTDKHKERLNDMPESKTSGHRDEHGWGTTKLHQDNPAYAGMIESTDESVGRVMTKLKSLGLDSNTVIIFMSDNGGLSTLAGGRRRAPTACLPLRAGKGWYYEGGIREPMIIKWPGAAKGGAVCSEVIMSTDFYPTMLEMAGLKLRPHQHVDGLSLVGLLKGKGELKREAVYWHSPHYHGSGNRPCGAIRSGDYKLIEWFEDGSVELYNLQEDMGEQNDLASEMPQKVAELKRMLRKWRKEVDARVPVPNPDWKG